MKKINILSLIAFTVIAFSGILFSIKMAFPNNNQMTIVPHKECDNDLDGDCDYKDYKLITKALGECVEGNNYNEPADANHDGCVTEDDLRMLFPEPPQQ